MNIQQENYSCLLELIPNLFSIKESGKSEVSGFMDWNLDILIKTNKGIRIAISHYYKAGGDMVADPDMELFVNRIDETVEALTYQDTMIYQSVEDAEGDAKDRLIRDLTDFLTQWLKNLKEQGHLIE